MRRRFTPQAQALEPRAVPSPTAFEAPPPDSAVAAVREELGRRTPLPLFPLGPISPDVPLPPFPFPPTRPPSEWDNPGWGGGDDEGSSWAPGPIDPRHPAVTPEDW